MISVIVLLLCSVSISPRAIDAAPVIAKSRQYIEPLPGLIPVYIRPGDTPLEDINLDLAEAFDSYAQKHGRFIFGRSSKVDESVESEISEAKIEENNNEVVPKPIQKETVINLNDLSLDVPVAIALPELSKPTYIHIQKIPRKSSS